MSKTAIALVFAFGTFGPATACELYPDRAWTTMNNDRWGFGPDGFVKPGDCPPEPPQFPQHDYQAPQYEQPPSPYLEAPAY
jgi:hypothetical protein